MANADKVWKSTSNGQVPHGAYQGGREQNRKLYICRASHSGGVHPGKLVDKYCNFGYGGKEMLMSEYQVLVAN